jgi:hypothetical protein
MVLENSNEFLRKKLLELKALHASHHPNIVDFHGAFYADGTLSFILVTILTPAFNVQRNTWIGAPLQIYRSDQVQYPRVIWEEYRMIFFAVLNISIKLYISFTGIACYETR